MGPGEDRAANGDPVVRGRKIAVSLLARHAWSVSRMRERLIRRGIGEAAAERVVAELLRAGLLGDSAFAEDAARLELSRRPAADAFLEHRLVQKGVGEKTAARAAKEASEGVSELDRARALARRSARPNAKDPGAARRRLLGVLARRGFEMEIAERAVEEVLGAEPEPSEDPGMGMAGGGLEHDL